MNAKVFLIVVIGLVATLVLSVLGVIVLLVTGNPVDDILKQAITGLVTGLLGLMVRSPSHEPTGTRADPVHVDPIGG